MSLKMDHVLVRLVCLWRLENKDHETNGTAIKETIMDWKAAEATSWQ